MNYNNITYPKTELAARLLMKTHDSSWGNLAGDSCGITKPLHKVAVNSINIDINKLVFCLAERMREDIIPRVYEHVKHN